MKKLFITMAVVLCAASVSAQDWVNQATDASKWALGARVGSGFQAQAEYRLSSGNYVEGRFGMSWCNGGASLMADFTALYNWNICNMDWTPGTGEWFFDAGCGLVIGGREHYCYLGAAGQAKLGIKFNNVPLRLSVDWTPYIGPGIGYWKNGSSSRFNEYGFANFGISCVYCF